VSINGTVVATAKKFPLHPKHPERICWGCDKYCSADSLDCGNGSGRTQHPAELLGDDWYEFGDWDLDEVPVPDSGLPKA
jgi:hypothetical protein